MSFIVKQNNCISGFFFSIRPILVLKTPISVYGALLDLLPFEQVRQRLDDQILQSLFAVVR